MPPDALLALLIPARDTSGVNVRWFCITSDAIGSALAETACLTGVD